MLKNRKTFITIAKISIISLVIYKIINLRLQKNMFVDEKQFDPESDQELDLDEHYDKKTLNEIVNE